MGGYDGQNAEYQQESDEDREAIEEQEDEQINDDSAYYNEREASQSQLSEIQRKYLQKYGLDPNHSR